MAVFSSTDWNRRAGDIIEAARRAPVTITQRKRPAFVVMSYDAFERLSRGSDTRKFHSLETLPEDLFAKAAAAYEAMKNETAV